MCTVKCFCFVQSYLSTDGKVYTDFRFPVQRNTLISQCIESLHKCHIWSPLCAGIKKQAENKEIATESECMYM